MRNIKVKKDKQVLFLIFPAFGMLFFSHAAQLAEVPEGLPGFKSEGYKPERDSEKITNFCEVRSESHLGTSGLKKPEKEGVPLSTFLKNRIVSRVASRFSKDISSHYENGILFRSKDSQFRSFYSSLEAYIQELGSSNFDKLTDEGKASISSGIQLIIEETEDFCNRHATFYNLIPEDFRKGKIEKCKIEVLIEKWTFSNVKTLSIDLVKATSRSINCLQEFVLQHNDLLPLIYNRVKSEDKAYNIQSKLLGVKENLEWLIDRYQEIIDNRDEREKMILNSTFNIFSLKKNLKKTSKETLFLIDDEKTIDPMQKQEIKPKSVVLSDRVISKDISTFLKDISFHKRSARLFRAKADSFNLFYSGLQVYIQELESSNFEELMSKNEVEDMCCGVQLIGKEIEDFCRSHIESYDLIPENFKKGEVDICKIEIPATKDSPAKSRTLSGELVSATYESISCLQEFILNYSDLLFLLYNRAGDQSKECKIQSELLEAKENLTLLFNKYKEVIENISKKKMT